MLRLKQDKILKLNEEDVLSYVKRTLAIECLEEYGMQKLII
jgi:hypothetical protein